MKLRQRRRTARTPKQRPRVSMTCVYCHDRLRPPERAYCASCLAPHHRDCFQLHGECSAAGCDETQVLLKRPKPRRRTRHGSDVQRHRLNEVALTSLIFGVIAIMVCGLVSPFAILKANEAKRLATKLRLPVPAYATGGLVLGWLSLVGLILAVLWMLVLFAAFAAHG